MGFELRIERNFDGAPDDVYDALLAIYDEPLPDWVLTSQRDLRVGGVWHITFKPPGAEAFSEHRIITAADRPNLLSTARPAHPPAVRLTTRPWPLPPSTWTAQSCLPHAVRLPR